ncbi:55_t:CDS:2 [Entrophospora sp. SA101]|nr:55_t:CDS:2 [Entrophospora sp. SA101]
MKSNGQTESKKDPILDVACEDPETFFNDSYIDNKYTYDEYNTSPIELDLRKFKEAYLAMDPDCMWTLKTGCKVETVIYEFAKKLHKESYLHSFIINDADVETISLFSPDEWKEIKTFEVTNGPKLDPCQKELLKKYTTNDIKKLRSLFFESFVPDNKEYNRDIHFCLEYINTAYHGILCLWEMNENPFDSLKDGVIRLYKDRLEFGAIEAGRKWEETNGTKYMSDSLKYLRLIGILHGANRLQVLTVDHPKGYITRINRNNVQEVAGRLSNAKPLAFVLKEVLYVRPTRLEVGLRYLRTYLWQRFGSDVTSSPFQILLKATLSTSTKNGIDSKNKNSIIKPTNLFSPPPSKLLLTKKCAKRTFDDDETCNKGTCSCSEEKEIGKDNADKSYNNNDDDIIANNSCSNYSYNEYDTFIDQSRRIDSTDSEEEEILPIITKHV